MSDQQPRHRTRFVACFVVFLIAGLGWRTWPSGQVPEFEEHFSSGGWQLKIKPDGSGSITQGNSYPPHGDFPAGTFSAQDVAEYQIGVRSANSMVRHAILRSKANRFTTETMLGWLDQFPATRDTGFGF